MFFIKMTVAQLVEKFLAFFYKMIIFITDFTAARHQQLFLSDEFSSSTYIQFPQDLGHKF